MNQPVTIPESSASAPDEAIDPLRQMMLIRRFEEKSAELYTKEKIRGFLHLYIGEEAVAVGVMQVLTSEDNILSTYREHGHALARGMDPGVLLAEMYGKIEGCSRGRGGSMHFFDKKNRFFGGNAIVGGHLGMAVGMALASKKRRLNNITCCFFGEGAVAEGEFHEALNLAALWKVPVLFVCENNLYAMGTAIAFSHSETAIEKKGAAYGIESVAVDGMDLMAVRAAALAAVRSIGINGRPVLLVCNTYRFRAHSMFDPELYRDKAEVELWKKRDPIELYKNLLTDQKLLTPFLADQLASEIESKIQAAVAFAEAGTPEPVEALLTFVYSNPSSSS